MNALTSIGIIPDGNRRYGKKHLFNLSGTYKKGVETGIEIIRHVADKYPEVKQMQVYTLSQENLDRTKEELKELMNVFESSFPVIGKLYEKDINLKFVGDFSKFPKSTKDGIKKINNKKPKAKLTVYFLMGYGGRKELMFAVNRILKSKKKKINEMIFRNYLYDRQMIDPDIIIRSSGVCRLSGFLTFQSAYSELFFIKKLWPEVNNRDIDQIIKEYRKIKRNFGK